MTLEGLHEIYRNARLAVIFSAKDEELVADVREQAERAGIRAVVKALRDEIEEIGFQEEMPFDPVIDFLNEILASREGGQAAGEATRADNSAPLPAAPEPRAFRKCAACQPTLYSEERCRTSGCEWSKEFTVYAAPAAPAPVRGGAGVKSVDHEEARAIAQRFINAHFRNVAERPRISIPANPDRDDDLLLHAYITQSAATIEALRAEVARLTKSEEGLLKTLGLERRAKHAAQTENARLKGALEEAVKWMEGCAVSGGYPAWYAKARKALAGETT